MVKSSSVSASSSCLLLGSALSGVSTAPQGVLTGWLGDHRPAPCQEPQSTARVLVGVRSPAGRGRERLI